MKCREMRLRILHPGEDHLGPCERVGDHCIQNLLREGSGKLPWRGEVLHLIMFALPPIIPQTPAQLLIYTMELFVPHVRGFEIRLHAFLFQLLLRHTILQPPHYLQDLLHGQFFWRCACSTSSCGGHSSLSPQTSSNVTVT